MFKEYELAWLEEAGHDAASLPEDITRELFASTLVCGAHGDTVVALIDVIQGLLNRIRDPKYKLIFEVPDDNNAIAALERLGESEHALHYTCDLAYLENDQKVVAILAAWNNTAQLATRLTNSFFPKRNSWVQENRAKNVMRGVLLILWEAAELGTYVSVSPKLQNSFHEIRNLLQEETQVIFDASL